MGHNRTACILSVTSVDILPEFQPGSEWNDGAKVIGGVYGFCGICGSVSGVGKFKNENTNRTR